MSELNIFTLKNPKRIPNIRIYTKLNLKKTPLKDSTNKPKNKTRK
jgi:hypothetical protein